MVTIAKYGGGQLYGTADLLYGRIDPAIAIAQTLTLRQTDLRVKIYDDHLNDWSVVAGSPINYNAYTNAAGIYSYSQSYSAWRLQMGMCALSNGHIIRVRVGDGTQGNRNIYVNDITDPTNASQWTSWSLLYSGTFYGVAVVPATASTYHVYHSDSVGVRKNNVAKQTLSGIIYIAPVQGAIDAMFVTRVFKDTLDSNRVMDVAYSSNIEALAFTDDVFNYRLSTTEMSAILLSDGRVARFQTASWFTDPRNKSILDTLTVVFNPSLTVTTPIDPPRIIRGFGGQAGFNSIRYPHITKLTDGFYYLFYGENRYDADKDNALSVATLFWQRSKDLVHWTEPVAIGYDQMTPSGHAVVETGGSIYLANNGESWKRIVATTTYDISNYIPSLQMNIPPTGEDGSANFTVANPGGINDYLENLSDHRMTIEVGIRTAGGAYGYVEFGNWWLSRVKKEIEAKVNRLVASAYDIHRRLQNPLRDVFNFPGQVVWADWYLGRRNKLFNYYIRGGKATFRFSKTGLTYYYYVNKINKSHITLYTGWKGHNFDCSVRFRGGTFVAGEKFGIIFRYKDGKTYYWAGILGDVLKLQRRRSNVTVTLASYSIGSYLSNPTIKIVVKFGFYYVYLNGVLRITHNETIPSVNPGYVGIRYYRSTKAGNFGADLFSLTSWETSYTSDDLVSTALSMGDLHDYTIDAGDEKQVAVVWGPQTDLNSPAAALDSLFSQLKLDMGWRNNILQVGKFTDITSIKTIQNESLEFKVTEETGQRINLAIVDGQEDTFTAIDGLDSRSRGRQIVAYFDVPELDTTEKVVARANEEIRQGVEGVKYEGKVPLLMDLWRLDAVTWYDPTGVAHELRIDGITIDIEQGEKPSQHGTYTLSPLT